MPEDHAGRALAYIAIDQEGGSRRRIMPDDSLALIAVDLAHLVFEVKDVPVNRFSPPHWQ